MKKRTLPNSETLKQYIFDYGMDKACELWNITPDEANKILNPTFKDIHYKYIREKKYKKLNPEYIKIKKIIAENYELIYNRMNKHKKEDIYLMCEAKKDFYHNAILKIMESDIEDITLENIINQIKIYYATNIKYSYLSDKYMKQHISPLEMNYDEENYLITETKKYALNQQTNKEE